jgi:hypothetical protein
MVVMVAVDNTPQAELLPQLVMVPAAAVVAIALQVVLLYLGQELQVMSW